MKRLLCCLLILSAPLCDAQQPQGRAPAKSPNVPDGITYLVQ
ncbi:MAG: hypothetical protein P8M62_07040 [Opitutae bacterium]|nr:hypothetical protein [Opitutae bacterium]MDG2345790.1 hypothetical protein [Opitutae bacterium]